MGDGDGVLDEPAEHRVQLLADLVVKVDKLDKHLVDQTGTVKGLRDDVSAETRHRRTLGWLIAIHAFVVAIAAIGAVMLSVIVVTNRATIAEIRKGNSYLVECTTPGDPAARLPADRVHVCFDRTTASQAAIVMLLQSQTKAAAIATSRCSLENVGFPDRIPACVDKRLASSP